MQVKAHYREGRKKPWEARWWVHRRMRTKFFATQKERDKFIRDFSKEIGAHGSEVFTFDKERMRRWQEAEAMLPEVDPVELARHWLETHRPKKKLTISEGVVRYLRELELAGRTPEYRAHTRKCLERFCAEHGERGVSSITSEEVAAFIHALPFSALSKRHYRTYLATAFKWFVGQGYAQQNPVTTVPVPKVNLEEPGILTVEETEALFRANEREDPEICGLLALGAFAGMRSSAIARVDYDELDFENRAILTPASKTKKGRRHYIEELPENLWSWLERAPQKAFKMTPRQYAHRRTQAFRRAGLLVTASEAKRGGIEPKSPPKNCLRHSFVSYHVALHRDPGKTALLVSHKNQAVLWEHYLGVAKQEGARRYFGIRPFIRRD